MVNNYNEIFRARTKSLCIKIIRSLSTLRYSDDLSVIRKQIYRSSTSIAANYRAACRARSEKEKFSKLCIVVEEADETQFWLEIIAELDYVNPETLIPLQMEIDQIVKVMTTYKYRLAKNLQQ